MKRIFIIIFSLSVLACSQTSDEKSSANEQDGWITLSNSDYSINYPPEWEFEQSGLMGSSFILYIEPANSTDHFRKNINLLIQDLSGQSIDLDKFVEISEEQIEMMVNNSKLIESKRENEYHKIIYTGNYRENKLKWIQYYWINNNNAYILTFTTPHNSYHRYIVLVEKVFDTFKINK